MARSRPWRAVAFIPDPTAPNGRRRVLAGRTAACTEDGLRGFLTKHRRQGHACQVFRISELDLEVR